MTEPRLVELPSQSVLSVRRITPVAGLGRTQDECLNLLRTQLHEQGLTAAGAPFAWYHEVTHTEMDVEVGVPIITPGHDAGEVKASTRSGGPALTLWHLGPHDSLGESYRTINTWVREHGREASGTPWEVYEWLDVPTYDGNLTDPGAWRTQLVQPLRGEPV